MGMFDFRDYSAAEAAELAKTSHALAVASAVYAFRGVPGLGDLVENVVQSPLFAGSPDGSTRAPDGWQEISAEALGIDPKDVDSKGLFKVPSPILGDTEGTVQAMVYGQYDASGTLTGLSISWAATNNPLDVLDFSKLPSGEVGALMEPFVSKVAAFAQANGLGARDVLITGYSLGAAYTNIMADNKDSLADGFFAQSDYVGHNGPVIRDYDNLINFGYENDIVYRATADTTLFNDALQLAGPLLEGSDFNLANSIDNVVLFDGAYASPLFPFGPFSILNIPGGWYAHIDGLVTDSIDRITGSVFYDLTEKDTAVVVSNLGADLRWSTWVEDKKTLATSDHHDKAALLIGTDYDDLLRDGIANDYFDGRAGDDIIRVSTGYDTVHGGAGTDILRLRGDASDWQAYRLSDGTLALASRTGDGLKLAIDIEKIQFEGLAIGKISLINKDYLVQADELRFDGSWFERWFNSDLRYEQHEEGTAGDDILSGQSVFARDGDDTITGTGQDDLLHGGRGQDRLDGGLGDDRLYGAEHDDVLYASHGDDLLNGGHGDDLFVFTAGLYGTTTVEDFNRATDQHDQLSVVGLFDGFAQVQAAAAQRGADTVIDAGALEIVLANTQVTDLAQDDFIFA